jgi:hypothetical protein
LTFNGLHNVIYQKIVLFITPAAVRTSNPTPPYVFIPKLEVPEIPAFF